MRRLKGPSDTLDYTMLWSKWLDAGDTIQTATWAIPDGLTQPQAATRTTTTTTVWLAGGTDGDDYVVSCTITTTAGRVRSRRFTVSVRAG